MKLRERIAVRLFCFIIHHSSFIISTALAQSLPPPPTAGGDRTSGGGLRWTATRIELRAAAGADAATVLEARYPFVNAGTVPVEIASLQSDCGCTVPELARRRLAPGEQGEILARFTVGERVGRQEMHVTLAVVGQTQPTTLTLVVLIPELLRLRPGFLWWRQGEEKTPKTLAIAAGEGVTVRRLGVHSSQALFACELRVVEEGRHHELRVTPERTDLPLMAQLSLTGEFEVSVPAAAGGGPGGSRTFTKVLTAHAAVKAPAPPPAAELTGAGAAAPP